MTRIIADISISLDGFVTTGLAGPLRLHLGRIVLGAGTPGFTGGAPRTPVQRSAIPASTATHLTYDVSR